MNDILKSKRFWTAVIGGILGVVVVLIPELEPYAEQLLEAIVLLFGGVIGGYSIQDAVVSYQTGTSKYSNGATDD